MQPTRWATERGGQNSSNYLDRFRRLAAEGVDLAGEARFVDALVTPAARILDAGCGAGRVGAALTARGHSVVGVDADAALIDAARADHPDTTWLIGDLTALHLPAPAGGPFDAAVLAGNVLPYLAPGTERDALRCIADQVRRDGPIVVGFGADRGYALPDFDRHCASVNLTLEHRFGTWDLRRWTAGADFAVSVLRVP